MHAREAVAGPLIGAARLLAQRANAVDLRGAEEVRTPHEPLLRTTTALLHEAADVLGLVAGRFDDLEGDERAGDAPASEEQELADIASISAMSLAEKGRLLGHIDADTDRWEVVDRFDRVLRAVVKTMTAVEQALCAYSGVPPELGREDETARGLRIRTAYAKLRRELEQSARGDAPLAIRIRRAAASIAMLVGRDVYPLMRVADRRQLRTLQERMRVWLNDAQRDSLSGEHLWQEMGAVTDLLFGINRRAELTLHDETLLANLAGQLRDGLSPRDLLPSLKPLAGLDAELDVLLLSADADSELWSPVLRRVLEEHAPHESN